MLHGLQLIPQYREYVWGGSRLRPERVPTAEAWVVYEHNQIASGVLEGKTLAEVCRQFGADLLGWQVVTKTGLRFPLLVKLLDCAAWLSLQVHPNDEQARLLEGPGFFGKTEAWHFIEADPNAEILYGVLPGVTRSQLAEAIRNGAILELMQHTPVQAGDSVLISPGTIHALGPGVLVYEVQQTSDLTYRVFDWNRPASQGRPLHIDQSLLVANPQAPRQFLPAGQLQSKGVQELISCEYFTLERIVAGTESLTLNTGQVSFHALTVIDGRAEIEGEGWALQLERFDSIVVPACCDSYQVRPLMPLTMLRSRAAG